MKLFIYFVNGSAKISDYINWYFGEIIGIF